MTTKVGDFIQPCHDGTEFKAWLGPIPARLGAVHQVEKVYPDGSVGYRRGSWLFICTSWIRRPKFKR